MGIDPVPPNHPEIQNGDRKRGLSEAVRRYPSSSELLQLNFGTSLNELLLKIFCFVFW
jgi:hypothetical protein